ncbi:MAG: ATP-dependent DNA helicase RecG [Treponema sp.]|nr:MAG: ATP-dependent DNA helicase RecG [Treponema sp.]
MLLSEIQIPVARLFGAGDTTVKFLSKLGVNTVGDLLSFWPRTWEDRSKSHLLKDWNTRQKIQVAVEVVFHDWFGFGRMKTLKLIVKDKTGMTAELVCYNRSFLQNVFPIGSEAIVFGSFVQKYGKLQSSSFEIDKPNEAAQKVLPVYHLTQGLGQTKIRKLIKLALSGYAKGIDSSLPASIMQEYNIPEKEKILQLMHSPEKLADTEIGVRSIIFEELFLYQYALGMRSFSRRGSLPKISDFNQATEKDINPKKIPEFSALQKALVKRLEFELTEDQLTTVAEINENIDGSQTLSRLIQGDVGSGKTLTAFLACIKIIEQGGQTALLAPTELLAKQHAENAAKLLEPIGIRIAFLTGNVKAKGRSNLLRELREGNIDLIVGTHALFSKNVKYNNLRLAVIDEQHRFGVLQRAAIIQKGIESNAKQNPPHLIMMSATPIPRTLAMSVFGDMDISNIKTMPKGRKPVITYVANENKSEQVYDFIGKEILKGRQAYFVYPLIEESEALSLKSAEKMFAQLQEGFPNHRLELIHSKISEPEQERIMSDFRDCKVHILVSTSVVEVGVDVPNATCMAIEHAERFGLAALHQLRGRVGRGDEQSYCFFVYGKNITPIGRERLKIIKDTNDGFVISEEDLRLRGPGDIGGIEQSGYDTGFRLANPVRDFELLQKARTAAFNLIKEEHNLE